MKVLKQLLVQHLRSSGGCLHKCSKSAKVLNTCAPREVVSTSAPPSGVSASQTANRDPYNARRAGTLPSPSTWDPCSGPYTRSSWGPKSSFRAHSDTPCSSAAARRPRSPPQDRSPAAGGGPQGIGTAS